MIWFLFAFLTAFFESLKDIASKKTLATSNEYIVAWSWMFFPAFFLLPVLLVQGIPPIQPNFWMAVIAGGITNTIAFNLYTKALKASDLSITVPMIAFTPIFLLVTSPLIVDEFPEPLGIVGIMLIVAGSYILNLKEKHKGFLAPYKALIRERGPKLMLGVAFLWSLGANIDKVGIQNSSAICWIVAITACMTLFMTPIMLWHTKDKRMIVRHAPGMTLIGICSTLVSLCQMTALMMTLVAYVIAVKRTSILMSVVSGYLIFHEKGIRERLPGTLIMIAGILCITLS